MKTILAATCLLLFSCGSAGGADTGQVPDTAETPDSAPDVDDWPKQYGQGCDQKKRVGRFVIIQSAKYGSAVAGSVADSVNEKEIFTPKESDGPCWLMQGKAPFCEPACAKDQQCTHEQKCVPYPKPMSAGKITVTGLIKQVELSPKGAAKSYAFTDFDDAPFEAGSHVELSAAGYEVQAFSLQGAGVPEMEIPETDWVMKKGQAFTFEWTASPGPWKILVVLNVDAHALSDTNLYCEVEDSGSYTIPSSLVDTFLDYGVHGAPTVLIYRRTIDSTNITEGCIEMTVQSKGEAYLKVE